MVRTGAAAPAPAVGLSTRLLLVAVVVIANIVGAGVVLVFAAWVVPQGPAEEQSRILLTNLVVFGGYLGFAVPVGVVWGWRRFRVDRAGGRSRPFEDRERLLVLGGPMRLVTVQGALWMLALVVFTTLNAQFSLRLAINVGSTVFIGGVTTCAVSYLLSERALRPAAARVLSARPPTRQLLPGVTVRSVLFWILGTAVPVGGLLLVATGALVYPDISRVELAITILALAGNILVVGFLVTVVAARATAGPVKGIRKALRRVERGDLDARVTVYDGTELGLLQAGFNRMVAGLAERERLRDLFGRHVGQDVAREALAGDVELGGEAREVAVLFVDLLGSTALAADRPPGEVVDVLNAFFAVVVEEVERAGGWINKFAGDAALAVFGAPTPMPDPAGCALAAGRALAARLRRELPDTPAGVGVAAGQAVAGNIGTAQRFEYTVIGDPVNEAARLTELAKGAPGGILASGTALQLADAEEARHWEVDGTEVLRGRSAETRLARPCDVAGEPAPERR